MNRFDTLLDALISCKDSGAQFCRIFDRKAKAQEYHVPEVFSCCWVFRRAPDGFQQWQFTRLQKHFYTIDGEGRSEWAVEKDWYDSGKGPAASKAHPIEEIIDELKVRALAEAS